MHRTALFAAKLGAAWTRCWWSPSPEDAHRCALLAAQRALRQLVRRLADFAVREVAAGEKDEGAGGGHAHDAVIAAEQLALLLGSRGGSSIVVAGFAAPAIIDGNRKEHRSERVDLLRKCSRLQWRMLRRTRRRWRC